MAFQELYFTFPRALTTKEEDVFIGHVLAVRDSQVLRKARTVRAAAALQAKVPFNPMKAQLEGFVMQSDNIINFIGETFVLEPVEGVAGKYVLRLSEALNMGKVDKVTKLLRAFASQEWIANLLQDMKVETVQVGANP